MRHLPLHLALALGALACTHVPSSTCTSLGTFPGPEDFDLVTREGNTQLIASATERRDPTDTANNGFWLIDWDAEREVTKLAIHGRDDCPLAPHGISTVELEPGRWQLWAVVHFEHEACEGLDHAIEHFELASDGLHFIERLSGPELTNPNDLDALPDGRLWISNNPPWPGGKGLAGDMIFRRAKGQVVHRAPGVGFSVAAADFVYPNGIYIEPDSGQLWVSASAGDLFRLSLDAEGHEQARERVRVKPKATLDNFLLDPVDEQLWVTGHPKNLAFIRHLKDSSKHAPTIAYRIDRATMSAEAVGHWREGEVEAGSSVVPLDDQLVLAQVFEPGLRVCEHPTSD